MGYKVWSATQEAVDAFTLVVDDFYAISIRHSKSIQVTTIKLEGLACDLIFNNVTKV